jgi:hypothetical protein
MSIKFRVVFKSIFAAQAVLWGKSKHIRFWTNDKEGKVMRVLGFLVLTCILSAASFGAEQYPQWAAVSTEVDEFLFGTGFMQRHALKLVPPEFKWANSGSIFFDPGAVFGVDMGLDAYHYSESLTSGPAYNLHYFSSEVDFIYEGVAYRNEELLAYDETTGGVTSVLDVVAILGHDYGLDAACFTKGIWAFSTEVGSELSTVTSIGVFTDGDIIAIVDGVVEVFRVTEYFPRNMGLDALHFLLEEEESLSILMSTEVDGTILDPRTGAEVAFRDEDILRLGMFWDDVDGDWYLGEVELGWEGVEGFGRDVGLDALYVAEMIPEPAAILMAGFGLIALLSGFRKR